MLCDTMLRRLTLIGCLSTALLATVWACAQEASLPAPGPARVVRQWVQPEVYRGACPVTLRFFATLEKGGWGPVTYRWVRSDGQRTPVQTIDFDDWRSKQVSMAWRVDGNAARTVWASVEILKPPRTEVRAAKAVTRIFCSNRSSPESDPCSTTDLIGPISSNVRLCLLQRYDEAGVELTGALHRLGDTLRPAEDETDATIVQAEANRHRALLDSQQHWENFRESACQEVYFEYWPGSMADEARLECLVQLTESRTQYLEERIGNEPDGDD